MKHVPVIVLSGLTCVMVGCGSSSDETTGDTPSGEKALVDKAHGVAFVAARGLAAWGSIQGDLVSFAAAEAGVAVPAPDRSFGQSCPQITVTNPSRTFSANVVYPTENGCAPANRAYVAKGTLTLQSELSGTTLTVVSSTTGLQVGGLFTRGQVSCAYDSVSQIRRFNPQLPGACSFTGFVFSTKDGDTDFTGGMNSTIVYNNASRDGIRQVNLDKSGQTLKQGENTFAFSATELTIDPASGALPSAGKIAISSSSEADGDVMVELAFNSDTPVSRQVMVRTLSNGEVKETSEKIPE